MKKYLLLGLGGFFAFTNGVFAVFEQKIIIDQINKKILIQSGDQTLSLDDYKNQVQATSGSQTLTTSTPLVPAPTPSGTTTATLVNSGTTTGTTSIPLTSESSTISNIVSGATGSALFSELGSGSELEKAIFRMHKNGLTIYEKVTNYRPQDQLTRAEAAKIVTQAYLVLGYPQVPKTFNCSFSDINLVTGDLFENIEKSCQYGIFNGNAGTFSPLNPLTKAEALTVLVRIFEGVKSNESLNPRWTMYFIKAKAIALTTEIDVNAMARPITREEIALLIYRFKNILLNDLLKSQANTKVKNINQNPTSSLQNYLTGSLTTGDQKSTNPILNLLSGTNQGSTSLSVLNNPEITEAMHRMREYGLTSASDITSYQAFEPLTREQAAKMFVQFAKVEKLSALSGAKTTCNFKDINLANPNLLSSIQEVCKLGLMQGTNGLFAPNQTISKSQFITLLIRLSNGSKLDESGEPRWKNYFLKAQEMGLISNDDVLSFESPMTRYEAALIFYRFRIKQKILTNLNTSQLKNELISTIKNTDNSSLSLGTGIYAVSIDSNLLKNQFFQEGFIELLGQRYQLKKTNITTFDLGHESFVWYGDLFEISNQNKIGNLNFIVSNGNIIDGSIRLVQDGNNWKITPDTSTTARYQLSKELSIH